MPYVTGYLNIVEGGRPDQGLPGGGFGGGPVDPSYGQSAGLRPSNELPGSGGHPSHGLPGQGGRPSNELPGGGYPSGQPVPGGERPSNELPAPPPGIWPPPSPSNPIVPVPPESGGGDASTKPIEPGTIWPPLAPGAQGKFVVVVWVPGYGYRYTVVDTSLSAGMPLPGGPPEHASGQPVPPTTTPPAPGQQPTPPTSPAPAPQSTGRSK